ncbi:PHB depolymerase family esterase [Halobacillus sp. Marseille-Q1614]|uniref:alpha/beta hydrolase family esterase n=1 Tax=Halobacillus sp. Marseille-Q1614 TaxID=2709134 RepID=UPI00156FF648|nr:PHB depolymerase family esterase [Halobacillus sp. Marseille-Q1614]
MKSHIPITKEVIPSKDGERVFYYTLPEQYDEALPIVFSFHGAGSSAKHHISLTTFHERPMKEEACFVFPEALMLDPAKPMTQQWNEGRSKNLSCQQQVDDTGFVMNMLDYFREKNIIDEERIYLTGFSNGSAFSLKLAIEYPELFAGVGGVGGPVVKEIAEKASWTRAMPLIFFMGEKDPVVPYDGNYTSNYMIDQLLSAKETVYEFAKSLPFPVEEQIDKQGEVSKLTYLSKSNSAQVVLYSMRDSGHTWPGGPAFQKKLGTGKVCEQLDATDMIWKFLKVR